MRFNEPYGKLNSIILATSIQLHTDLASSHKVSRIGSDATWRKGLQEIPKVI